MPKQERQVESSWEVPVEKIPTRRELQATLTAAKRQDERDYVILVVASNAALRISEIIHLKVIDYLGRGHLRVTRRKKRTLKPTVIDIQPSLDRILKRWVDHAASSVWMFPGRSTPCILTRESGERVELCPGGHVSIREMERRMKKYTKAAGAEMKGRNVHALRHYGITEFDRANKDLVATQQFGGHSSPAVTVKYVHVREMREKVGKMKPTL